MAFVTFVLLVLVLAIGLVPVWLLRHAPNRRAQDRFVGAQRTRLAVVRNASIAYALRMVAFIALFAWGARGDLLPAVTVSACFGLGTWLVYVARRPLLDFLDEALAGDGSVTVHAFIAKAHGNDPRVRLVAAGFALCALFGLVVCEALAAAAFLWPMLKATGTPAAFLFVAALLSIAATAVLSGHTGIMHSAQLQLGMLYFGLFGATLLVLYLHLSSRTPLPQHVALAIAYAAGFGVLVLWYRRSRYVDTETIRSAGGEDRTNGSRTARTLGRFGKILNGWLSVLLVLLVVLAFMDLHAADLSRLARESAATLAAGTRISGVALFGIGLLALFYPLVDVTNWLRLAATRRDVGVEADRNVAALRGVFAIYAAETTLIGLLVCAFGAIAGVVLAPKGTTNVLEAFAVRFVSTDNLVAGIASALLAICVFAAALTTTGALLAAGLCTLRYDVFAPRRLGAAPGDSAAASEATATRRTLVAGLAGLAVAFAVAYTSVRSGLASGVLPVLVSMLCCAQLSFAPLVLGPIVARARGGDGAVSPGWAAAVLTVGFGAGVAAVARYLGTGDDTWLWSAPPATLGSGFALFAIARAASPRAA